MTATEWNATYPIGTPVELWLANGKMLRTKTTSAAVRYGCLDHIEVDAIYPGTVLLSWCRPVEH